MRFINKQTGAIVSSIVPELIEVFKNDNQYEEFKEKKIEEAKVEKEIIKPKQTKKIK